MDLYELIKDLNFTSVAWQIFTPLCFSLADFVTGYIQAVINHDVKSQKMRVGLLHKTLIFLVKWHKSLFNLKNLQVHIGA